MNYPAPRLLAGLLALLGLAACGGKKKDEKNAAPKVQAYPVATLRPDSVTLFQDYPATIQGEQNVEIRPKVDGYVQQIFVDEGATVRKGQPLFRIFAPQYEQEVRTAAAGIQTAQANVDAAAMNVRKVQPLVARGIISKYQLESAQYTLESQQAALAQARATLANARTNQGYTLITSPSDGIVGTIPNKVGALVSSTSTDPLTTVSNTRDVYAYFSLSEKALLGFVQRRAGTTLQDKLANVPPVRLVLADGSLYKYSGRVRTAIGQVDTETGSSSFRATFPNPAGLLRSGSSGQVRTLQHKDKVLLVPQSATYELQGKRFAYVVGRDTAAYAAPITVTPTPDGQHFVVDGGLKAGQQIVLEGVASLKDGTKIKPVKPQPKKKAAAAAEVATAQK